MSISETTTVHRHAVAGTEMVLAELAKIRAEQERVGAAVAKTETSLVAQNKKLNESVAFWGKVNVTMTALPGIIGKVQSAFNEAADLLQQRSAAGAVNVGALDLALRGQLKTTELYTLAAAINSSELKLNASQQQVLAGSLRMLGLEGKNTTEAAKDFAKALATGEATELKKYGIAVADLEGKSKSFAEVLRDDLTPMAEKAARTVETEAESMRAATNDISDGITEAKTSLAGFGAEVIAIQSGREANLHSLGGMLVSLSGMSGMAGLAQETRKATDELVWLTRIAAKAKQLEKDKKQGEFDAYYAAAAAERRKAASSAAVAAWDPSIDLNKGRTAGEEAAARRGGGGRSDRLSPRELAQLIASVDPVKLEHFAALAVGSRYAGTTGSGTLEAAVGAPDLGMSREHAASIEAVLAKSIEVNAAVAASKTDKTASFLETTLGPIEQFDKYAAGFGLLQTAASAAMGAWIDGSKSATAAAREAISGELAAMAMKLTGIAVAHSIYGLAALAIGGPLAGKSASQHAAAAAAASAGAIALGGFARAVGGGAGSSGGGSGGAIGGGSGGAPVLSGNPALEGGAGMNAIIVVGDSFADDDQRSRQRKAQRLVDMARRERFN